MVIGGFLIVGFAKSRGFFANRPRLLMPCYFLAGVLGYIGGKLSYVGRCKSMFLELHDSRVKDFLLGNQSYVPFPPMPNFSMEREWSKSDEPVIVETPTTYAQRREYYRQQQRQGKGSSFLPPSTQSQDEGQLQEYSQQPQQQQQLQPPSSDSSPSTDYFDNSRPLSSFFSEDDYKPKD